MGKDSIVRISPKSTDIRTLKGLIPKPHKSVSMDDMDEVIIASASNHFSNIP